MTNPTPETNPAELSNDRIREEASEVLKDADFQQYIKEEGEAFDPFSWVNDFFRWLRNLFDWDLPVEQGNNAEVWTAFAWMLKILLVIGGVALVGYIAFLLIRHYFFQPKEETHEIAGVTQQQRVEAQELYLKLASDALAEKDYRRAIHYLFLASVSRVIRDAKFHASEFMTNREIAGSTDFSKFTNGQQLSSLFHEMVYYDEPRWFGKFAISQEDYQYFQQVYHNFNQQLRNS